MIEALPASVMPVSEAHSGQSNSAAGTSTMAEPDAVSEQAATVSAATTAPAPVVEEAPSAAVATGEEQATESLQGADEQVVRDAAAAGAPPDAGALPQ